MTRSVFICAFLVVLLSAYATADTLEQQAPALASNSNAFGPNDVHIDNVNFTYWCIVRVKKWIDRDKRIAQADDNPSVYQIM